MIALEVSINGEKFLTAGVADWDLITAHLTADRINLAPDKTPRFRFHIGGMTIPELDGFRRHLNWNVGRLGLEDAVTFRLVETDNVDPPAKRYRLNPEVDESPFTESELREMRYEDYLDLKAEFDPS